MEKKGRQQKDGEGNRRKEERGQKEDGERRDEMRSRRKTGPERRVMGEVGDEKGGGES